MTTEREMMVDAFYEIAKEDGNTKALETIRNKAFAKLSAGSAKELVTTSMNGKSFTYQINMPSGELFALVSAAIKKYNNDGIITASEVDFSNV